MEEAAALQADPDDESYMEIEEEEDKGEQAGEQHYQEEVPVDTEPIAPVLGHEANEKGWEEAEDWEGEEEEWPPAEDEVGVAPAWDAKPHPAFGAEPEPGTLVQVESTPDEEEVWMEFDKEEEEEEAPAPGEGFADEDDGEADEERLFGTVEVAPSEPSAKRLKTGQETRAAHLDASSLSPTKLPMTYVMRTQVRKGDTVRILSGELYGHTARVTAEVGYKSLECQLEESGEKVCLQRDDVQLPEPQKEERDPALSRKDIRILKELEHSKVPTKGVSADWRPKVPTPQQAPPRFLPGPRGSNSSKGEARTLQPAHRARSGKGSSDATSMRLSGLDSVLDLACRNIASGNPVEGYTSGKPSAPLAPAVENPVAAADEPSTRRGKGRGRGTARAKAAVPKQLPVSKERYKSEKMRKLRAQSEDPRYSGRGIV